MKIEDCYKEKFNTLFLSFFKFELLHLENLDW